MDAEIGSNLMDLRRKLAEAASALGKGGAAGDKSADSLERARELVRGVDSLGTRACRNAPRADRGQDSKGSRRQQQGQQAQPAAGPAGQARSARAARTGRTAGHKPANRAQGQRASRASRAKAGSRVRAARQGQGGQQGQGGGMGGGNNVGGWNDDGGWGNARPGNFGADDVRQFRGEARRYAARTSKRCGGRCAPTAWTRASSTRS